MSKYYSMQEAEQIVRDAIRDLAGPDKQLVPASVITDRVHADARVQALEQKHADKLAAKIPRFLATTMVAHFGKAWTEGRVQSNGLTREQVKRRWAYRPE